MKNNRGFTLIEIIVTLFITTIALIMSATFILNTMGFFSDESSTSLRKQSVDGISQYIHDQLIYATEVKIQINKPEGDDWQSLSVKKDGNLNILQHNDEDVYTDSYYLGERMDIIAKGYDKYRLDIKVTFSSTGEKSYSSNTTLELLNLKYEFEKKQSSKISQIETKEYRLSQDEIDYKIYYRNNHLDYEKKIEKDDSITPNEDIKTVEDEILCKDDKPSTEENPTNDKGKFEYGNKYDIGDFVYLEVDGNKQWYRALVSFQSEGGAMIGPNDNVRNAWKKITIDYFKFNTYFYGDVVRYNNMYYQVIKKSGTNGITNKAPGESDFWSEGFNTVEELRKSTNIFSSCTMGGQVDDNKDDNDNHDSDYWTVGGEFKRCGNEEEIKTFVVGETTTYRTGDFVRYKGEIYRYVYSDISGYWGEVNAPDKNSNHWKKITTKKDSHSLYYYGDIVSQGGKYYQLIWYAAKGFAFGINFDDNKTNPDIWKVYDSLEDLLGENGEPEIKPTCNFGN